MGAGCCFGLLRWRAPNSQCELGARAGDDGLACEWAKGGYRLRIGRRGWRSARPFDRAAIVSDGSSATSTRYCAVGLATSNTQPRVCSALSTALYEDGCAPFCASRKSGPVLDDAGPTINVGPIPSSPAWTVHPANSLCRGETRPMSKPATGEPCAGEPRARFGGRGARASLPLSQTS